MTGPTDYTSSPQTRSALDDLGQLVLDEHSTPSVLQRIVDLTQRSMPAGAEVSITLIRDDTPSTAAFTGQLADVLDESQYQRGHGPCLDAAFGGVLTEIPDARNEERWPEYIQVFLEHDALSALAVPVPAVHPIAALNVYARTADAFTDDDRSALRQFAAFAGAALTNMDALQDARDLAENLQKAMVFRSVIEQAKGILMERHKLTVDQAFRVLADSSMHNNRKVRDVAEELVLTGVLPDGPAAHRPKPPRGA